MKILCINYCIVIPFMYITNILMDHHKVLSMYIRMTEEGKNEMKTTFFDASKAFWCDKLSENRYEIYMEGVTEIQCALAEDVNNGFCYYRKNDMCGCM